jgi:predicted ArsR family transcriptional regulator
MRAYHQTQPYLSGDQVAQYETVAQTQEQLVLAFFQAHPEKSYSPEQIQSAVLPQAPITSVRRAITNLTTTGELVRTEWVAEGRYGRPIGMWQLAKKQVRQLGLF